MTKAPARKLKVFQAQFGFYDTAVAAPSQAAALRIWGTHQNLFANEQAQITTDAATVRAALQHPGLLLRRAAGSSDPFRLEPRRLPDAPPAPAKALARKPAMTQPAPHKWPASREKLDAAERALTKLDDQHASEEAEFQRQADALEAHHAAAREAHLEVTKAAKVAIQEARKAYRDAGGRD